MSDQNDARKPREVSRFVFPYYDLEASIEVAKALHNRAGGKASLIQLASYLGHKDEFSGAYRSKLWGAKLFGLVDITGNITSVTPLGEQLAASSPGILQDRKLAEAFLNVPLFQEIYRKYESATLPSTREGLKNALHETFGVSSNLLSLALKSFERSAEQAGFKRGGANRLIHPVPPGLINNEAAISPSKPEKTEAVMTEQANTTVIQNIHPAISGLLQELPPKGRPWNNAEMQRWVDAFVAIVKALYPSSDTGNQK